MNLSNETYLIADTRRTSRPIGTWLSMWYQNLRDSWAESRARARQMQELYRSTDRELWDMGLSRSDLPEIAKGSFRRTN